MAHQKGFHSKALKREAFAKRIEDKRILLKLSSSELAVKAGISRNTMQHYEEATAFPGDDNMIKLADALETTPHHLRGE